MDATGLFSDMKILFTTLHAKYSHASLALPSLAASCIHLSNISIKIKELTINEQHGQLLRQLLSECADLIGFSCYIWNIKQTLHLISDIKKISPQTIIVLGGPEVSFSVFELMNENRAIDFVIRGEGENVFKKLLQSLTNGNSKNLGDIFNLCYRESEEIVATPTGVYLSLDTLPSPFKAGLVDFTKPLTYYETSRGCPFSCAFCLSSTETEVRSYSIERIQLDLLFLMERKTATIKLVDRTFNYDSNRANQIWSYILKYNRGSHFHFEIAADLLTDENLRLLHDVPPNTFQFEIGIQSASAETLQHVSRKSDLQKSYGAIRHLIAETKVELHLDLVAGLPGENYSQFLNSLQIVIDLVPHQIQVEPLKVLKGSKMRVIAASEGYDYSEYPPYIILRNPWLSFTEICRIETVGKLLDLFYNDGSCRNTLNFLSQYFPLAELLDAMAGRVGEQSLYGLSTVSRFELLFQLVAPLLQKQELALYSDVLFYDYCRCEMPRAGKLPSFVELRKNDCLWPGRARKDLLQYMVIPEGAKVTLFRFIFLRHYRHGVANDTPTEKVFAYISTHGAGLKVVEL